MRKGELFFLPLSPSLASFLTFCTAAYLLLSHSHFVLQAPSRTGGGLAERQDGRRGGENEELSFSQVRSFLLVVSSSAADDEIDAGIGVTMR